MKHTHITLLILTALFLSSCHLSYASDVTDGVNAGTLTPITDTSPAPLTVYWENPSYYVTDHGGAYGLFSKKNSTLIREYSDIKSLSFIDTNGTVSQVTFAVAHTSDGKPILYTLDAERGERRTLTAEDSIYFCGDFVIIDRHLYTSALREMGSIYAAPLPEAAPRYDEMLTLSEADSHIEVRCYLAAVTDRGIQLPLPDDATDYTEFRAVGGGRYVGIFEEDGTVMSRLFFADTGHITPAGVYIYECTSPAVLMGKVSRFDRYRSTDIEFLVDSHGSFRLFAEGTITYKDGLITVSPFDSSLPRTIYDSELELIADNVFAYEKTTEGKTLIWHSNRIYGVSKNGDAVIHDNHTLSVADKDGNVTSLGEYDNVYALTDIGALIENEGKVRLISAHSMYFGTELAVLEGWNSGLVYTGQMSEAASEYRFVFTDEKNTDKNYDPLRMEWCYTDTNGKVSYKEYYGSVREGFYKLGLAD